LFKVRSVACICDGQVGRFTANPCNETLSNLAVAGIVASGENKHRARDPVKMIPEGDH
jgi:hypothetical protein